MSANFDPRYVPEGCKETHDLTHEEEFPNGRCGFCTNTFMCANCAHLFPEGEGHTEACPNCGNDTFKPFNPGGIDAVLVGR